jgi:hypothetical protein
LSFPEKMKRGMPTGGKAQERRGDERRNTAGLRILNQTAAVLEDRWAALCTETGKIAIEIIGEIFRGRSHARSFAH